MYNSLSEARDAGYGWTFELGKMESHLDGERGVHRGSDVQARLTGPEGYRAADESI